MRGASVGAALAATPPFLILSLIHHEPPRAPSGLWHSAEVSEVEGQDRAVGCRGDGHHGSIDEAEIEVAVGAIDGARRGEEGGRECGPLVGTRHERIEKTASRIWATAIPQHPIDFNDYWVRNDEVPTGCHDKRQGESVEVVAAIRCRDQRRAVSDDSHV